MQAKSYSLSGVTPVEVTVTVEATPGPRVFEYSGLAHHDVTERRTRVRAAVQTARADLSAHCICIAAHVNPPQKQKADGIDLATAAALLAALGKLDPKELDSTIFVGEVGISGGVHPVRGIAPIVRAAAAAGYARVVVSVYCLREADIAAQGTAIEVIPLGTLAELLAPATRPVRSSRSSAAGALRSPEDAAGDFSVLRGLGPAKRALEVAATGYHGVLLIGPPGSHKTMLARRLTGILPELTAAQRATVTDVYSVAGLLAGDVGEKTTRPFRAPHHSVTAAGLVGGGAVVRPGEVSLAHEGVLFLDDLLEFQPDVLQALATVLLAGLADIGKGRELVRFPASALLVCAVNPCPCGFAGEKNTRCVCTKEQKADHWERIRENPLFQFLDIQIVLPPFSPVSAGEVEPSETSAEVRKRVTAARELRDATPTAVSAEAQQRAFANREMRALSVHDRSAILRLSYTIPLLRPGADGPVVLLEHMDEAEGYRPFATKKMDG